MDGKDIVVLASPDGARAEVHLHGGHLLSWIPVGERDNRLYLSPISKAAPGIAIRGGVPVIFPQFASEGPLPKHGFARMVRWSLLHTDQDAQSTTAILRLGSADSPQPVWPQAFELRLRVRIGGPRLEMELAVANTGMEVMQFTAALHTYLRVGDIGSVSLEGLQGLRYRDSAARGAMREENADSVHIDGEVDRIYFDAPPALQLRTLEQSLRIEQSGFLDTVVWNPGTDKAAALADLEPGGYRRMLCVEAATVGKPVRLASGERWSGTQTLIAAG